MYPSPPLTNEATERAPTAVLDYRASDTGAHRVQRVMQELDAAETVGAAWVGVKLLAGIFFCLLPPFVVTLILKRFEWRWHADFLPGFEATWLLATAVMVPLLLRLERHWRGYSFGDGMRDGMSSETSSFEASGDEGFRRRNPALEWHVYGEIALTGPRLLRSAVASLRGKAAVDLPLRVVAAAIAIELFEAGQSLALQQLVRPDRPPPVVSRAVHYLGRCDWICTSARRDRVRLTTLAEKRLARM